MKVRINTLIAKVKTLWGIFDIAGFFKKRNGISLLDAPTFVALGQLVVFYIRITAKCYASSSVNA